MFYYGHNQFPKENRHHLETSRISLLGILNTDVLLPSFNQPNPEGWNIALINQTYFPAQCLIRGGKSPSVILIMLILYLHRIEMSSWRCVFPQLISLRIISTGNNVNHLIMIHNKINIIELFFVVEWIDMNPGRQREVSVSMKSCRG